jgi:putative transcriptional regulator
VSEDDTPGGERDSLAPSLLLAMPQMRDPNFERAVVLLCEHGEEGTMGLVVNRPTTTSVVSIVQIEDVEDANADLSVWVGGPVDTSRAWILSTEDPGTPERIQLKHGLFLAASTDALRRFLKAPVEEQNRYRFLLGYAGWAPGQLEGELAASAWLNAPLDPEIIFNTPPEQMWNEAIKRLGVDPLLLHMGPGVH